MDGFKERIWALKLKIIFKMLLNFTCSYPFLIIFFLSHPFWTDVILLSWALTPSLELCVGVTLLERYCTESIIRRNGLFIGIQTNYNLSKKKNMYTKHIIIFFESKIISEIREILQMIIESEPLAFERQWNH